MTDMQKMLASMVRPLTDDEFKAACLRHSGMNDLESIRRMGFDHKVAMVSRLLNPDAVLALQDPVAVHANMLRGSIAKPTWANILHLYPIESAALVAAAYADAAELLDDSRRDPVYAGGGCDPIIDRIKKRTPTDATAALERMLADARAEGSEMAAVKADAARQKYAIATYQSDDGRLQNAARCYCADEIAIDIRAMKGEGA